jgi:tRNA (guanine-N7-)-methyltransferase
MLSGCVAPHEVFPDWKRDFGRTAPLELEIGPGRGAFALDHAQRHPEIDLIVIESRRSDCELIRARAAKRGLRNLMVLHGDARLLVPRLFPPGSLAAVHLQFPDPWWKRRHHKRRMLDADFAEQMRALLATGGILRTRGRADLAGGGIGEAAGRAPGGPLHARTAVCDQRPARLSRPLPQSRRRGPPDANRTERP